MAGEKSDSAPGARGDEPREPGAFCVPVSDGDPLVLQSPNCVGFREQPGDIRFVLGDGVEVMRFEPGGKSYVYGKLVEDDVEATTWRAFLEFLARAKVSQ